MTDDRPRGTDVADALDLSPHAYQAGDLDCSGLLAVSRGARGQRPGVLLLPAVFGLTDHPQAQARRLAAMGYVVLTADLFGGGTSFSSLEEAMRHGGALMGDIVTSRQRLEAALGALRAHERVDPDRLAALGYCFGGTGALELACTGAPLRAAISIHGGLKLHDPAAAARIRASVLVCTGGEDPLVPGSDVLALQQQLSAGGVDWQVNTYGHALHAFTDPAADGFGTPAAGYDARADQRSWRSVSQWLDEALGG